MRPSPAGEARARQPDAPVRRGVLAGGPARRAGDRARDDAAGRRQRLPGRGAAAAGAAAAGRRRDAAALRITTTNSVEAARLAGRRPGRRRDGQHPSPAPAPTRSCSAGSASTGSRPGRGRARRASRCGRAWARSRCCAWAPAARGGACWTRCSARLRLQPAVDDRRPERVADALLRAAGAGHQPGPGAGARARRSPAPRHRARRTSPPIDVHLVCRPTLKRTRAVARFLDGLAEEARRAAALPAIA